MGFQHVLLSLNFGCFGGLPPLETRYYQQFIFTYGPIFSQLLDLSTYIDLSIPNFKIKQSNKQTNNLYKQEGFIQSNYKQEKTRNIFFVFLIEKKKKTTLLLLTVSDAAIIRI